MAATMLKASGSLTASKSAFTGKAVRSRAPVARQGKSSSAVAAERQVWFPGNAPAKHLDGSLPGDYGFDPLSLGSDPELLKWFQQAELIHCRTAMMGVAGILFPAIASKTGAVSIPEWYESGKVWIDGHPAAPFTSLLIVQLLLCGWAEGKRWADFKNPGSQGDGSFLGITDDLKGVEPGYPGGRYFDFLGLSKGPKYPEYKVKEIKNGRLAMVALVGFVFQYYATGKGPIDNLLDHVANPLQVTFASNGVSLPFLN